MIDQKTTPCEICNSETSAPIEHYPYWAVCSDCDNDLWLQSGAKPLNEGRCFNILCEYRWSETCFANERIGWPCDCGSTIWHKDEYNNTEEVNND